MAHGFLAASGLTLLAYAGLTGRVEGGAMLGLILLVVAAGGGVVMNLGYHIAGKLLPLWLLYLHIALAAAGTLLVAWALGKPERDTFLVAKLTAVWSQPATIARLRVVRS